MKPYLPAMVLLSLWLPFGASSQTTQPSSTMSCHTGPVEKTFGGEKWLVYSCDDNRTVVVVAAPNTPALPFYFLFSLQQGRYQLTGEGTGNRQATDAAYQELRMLSAGEIAALIAQTKAR